MATVEHTSSMADQPPLTEKGRTVRTLVEADLLDDRYATTQRGLKSRHVQLMALGGTIGTGKILTLATGFSLQENHG
jgi:amino acid transporter